MTENRFWILIGMVFRMSAKNIQKFGYEYLQNRVIEEYLKTKEKKEFIKFQEILCEKIKKLYLPKIGELFLMTGYDLSEKRTKKWRYISTDGFVDFRAWIVSLGKEDYEIFLNFQCETDLFNFDMDANRAEREDLIFLTGEIAGEEIDLAYPQDKSGEELYQNMNWDNLDEKYPKLFKLYQDRFTNGYYK